MIIHVEKTSLRIKVPNKGLRRRLRRLARCTAGYVWAYDRKGIMQAMASARKISIWGPKYVITQLDKRPLPKRAMRGKPVMR